MIFKHFTFTWTVAVCIVQHFKYNAQGFQSASGCHDKGELSLACSAVRMISFDSIYYGWSDHPDVCDLEAGGCNRVYFEGYHRHVIENLLNNFHELCTNRTSCKIRTSPLDLYCGSVGNENRNSTYVRIFYQCNSVVQTGTTQYDTTKTSPTYTTPPVGKTSAMMSTHTSGIPEVNPNVEISTTTDVRRVTVSDSTQVTALSQGGDDCERDILAISLTSGIVVLILIAVVVVLALKLRKKQPVKQHLDLDVFQNTHVHADPTEGATSNPSMSTYEEPIIYINSNAHEHTYAKLTHSTDNGSDMNYTYVDMQNTATDKTSRPAPNAVGIVR